MRRALRRALSFLIPPRCLECREEVLTPHSLCAPCWTQVPFISAPLCFRCGLPFEYEADPQALCGACVQSPPPYNRARAVFLYAPLSKGLLMRFKHGDETELAPAFAKWLSAAGREFLSEADFLVPVPLHWTRLLKRRYNQASLIARALARQSGIAYRPLGLRRCRATPSQGTKTKKQRHQNVAGAFQVPEKEKARLRGKKIILIDDVFTTGATVDQATKTLLKAGVLSVDVLTVARARI